MHERFSGAVVELVALGHHFGLRLREPHQVCVKRDYRQTVVCAIPRDHRGGSRGIKLGARLGKIAIEARLRLRNEVIGTTSERAGSKNTATNDKAASPGFLRIDSSTSPYDNGRTVINALLL